MTFMQTRAHTAWAEEQERRRQMGLPPLPMSSAPTQPGMPRGPSGGILGGESQQQDPMGGLLGQMQEPEAPRGFWSGGDKFRGRDAAAGLLAVLGDAFMAENGVQGGAVNMLAGGRIDAREEAKKRAAQQQELQRLIAIGKANGLSEQQVLAQHAGLKLPTPDQFDTMADRAGIERGSPEYREAARNKMIGDPFITSTLPNGQFYAGRASQIGSVLGAPQRGPTPGTIQDGYRFKGGDPSDERNWEQAVDTVGGENFTIPRLGRR